MAWNNIVIKSLQTEGFQTYFSEIFFLNSVCIVFYVLFITFGSFVANWCLHLHAHRLSQRHLIEIFVLVNLNTGGKIQDNKNDAYSKDEAQAMDKH